MTTSPIIRFLKDFMLLPLENFGKYYSTYRAFVADNEDPENLNRLVLIIPQVTGKDSHDYWAWPKNNYSGQGYGSQVLPQKGDVVWVEFEGGNPEVPVWTHGHFKRGAKPKIEKDLDDKNCYWFITPAGFMIKIHDGNKHIKIYTPDNDYIVLNSGKDISLVTEKNISLGKENKSKYSAVLGEELQDLERDLNKCLDEFMKDFNQDMITNPGPLIPKLLIKRVPQTIIDLAKIKAKIADIISKRVTLEK